MDNAINTAAATIAAAAGAEGQLSQANDVEQLVAQIRASYDPDNPLGFLKGISDKLPANNNVVRTAVLAKLQDDINRAANAAASNLPSISANNASEAIPKFQSFFEQVEKLPPEIRSQVLDSAKGKLQEYARTITDLKPGSKESMVMIANLAQLTQSIGDTKFKGQVVEMLMREAKNSNEKGGLTQLGKAMKAARESVNDSSVAAAIKDLGRTIGDIRTSDLQSRRASGRSGRSRSANFDRFLPKSSSPFAGANITMNTLFALNTIERLARRT